MTPAELHAAEQDLLEEAGEEPQNPRELREHARNGTHSWSVIDMAFWRLINRRELEFVDGVKVRRADANQS